MKNSLNWTMRILPYQFLTVILTIMPLISADISRACNTTTSAKQTRHASNKELLTGRNDIPGTFKKKASCSRTDSELPAESEGIISIETLLENPERFHKKIVTIRGIISQPEMHLDDTGLFFNFVFVLKQKNDSLVVFGHHDRTQGSSPIAMGNSVEVTGRYWKDRMAHDFHFRNNLEAITISPYPPLTPDRT